MSSAAETPVDPLRTVTALIEMGHVETAYRDVYLERADWPLVKQLAARTQAFLDRMPRYRVAASSVREALLDQQIACKGHAYEHGVDPAHIANWQWPF